MCSKFDQIRQQTVEFAALERHKKLHRLIMGQNMTPRLLAVFDQILFILACNKDIHKSFDEFEFRPDHTTDYRVSCP